MYAERLAEKLCKDGGMECFALKEIIEHANAEQCDFVRGPSFQAILQKSNFEPPATERMYVQTRFRLKQKPT